MPPSKSSSASARETDPQALLEDSKRRLGVDPTSVTRPEPALLSYYKLSAAFALIFFPLVFLPLWFRYKSLRYRIDDEGVSMSWGILNKREVFLTYRRLQDIQMTQGFIQRKFGLADLHLHTASGSAGAEMKLEGLPDPEAFRDYLYARMRGAEEGGEGREPEGRSGEGRDVGAQGSDAALGPSEALDSGSATPSHSSSDHRPGTTPGVSGDSRARSGGSGSASGERDEALALLREIRDELRRVNRSRGGSA
jgi:uncharacterized protein